MGAMLLRLLPQIQPFPGLAHEPEPVSHQVGIQSDHDLPANRSRRGLERGQKPAGLPVICCNPLGNNHLAFGQAGFGPSWHNECARMAQFRELAWSLGAGMAVSIGYLAYPRRISGDPLAIPYRVPSGSLYNTYTTPSEHLVNTRRMRENHACLRGAGNRGQTSNGERGKRNSEYGQHAESRTLHFELPGHRSLTGHSPCTRRPALPRAGRETAPEPPRLAPCNQDRVAIVLAAQRPRRTQTV